MSDYAELSGAGIKVIRAAFAAALSEQEGFDIASHGIDDLNLVFQNQFLTFMDYSPMGYPMGDELIPLADLYSTADDASSVKNEDSNEPEITNLDIQLDDIKAHLHDKLLNISPDFSPLVSLTNEYPVLNKVYEHFLRHSEFSGKVGSDSEQLQEAKNFLFPDDEFGVPSTSAAYKLYEQYADKYFELELQLSQARTSDSNTMVELLEQKLQRIQAEWLTIGRKNEVERALKILNTSDADAGYEDERNRYLELLESRLRTRLGSSEAYAAVTMSPLKPLVEPEDGLWQRLVITKEDIKTLLTEDMCHLFKIDKEELEYVLQHFISASLDYIRVIINREWLSRDFLNASYWRNQNNIISDGKGNGAAPTEITSVYFIKSSKLSMHAGLGIKEVGQVESTGDKGKTIIAYNMVKTPLINALIKQENDKHINKKHQFLNLKTINRLKTVNKMQTIETSKLKTIQKLNVSPRLLHKKFKMPDRKGTMLLKGVKKKPQPQLAKVSIQKPIQLKPHLVFSKDTKKAKPIFLNVTGRIKHKNQIVMDDVEVSYTVLDKNGAELESKPITLSNKQDAIVFSTKISNYQAGSKRATAQSVVISISDTNGDLQATKSLQFANKDKTVSIAFEVQTVAIDLALSSKVTPTLFAYGIKLLPKAPNPDSLLFSDESA